MLGAVALVDVVCTVFSRLVARHGSRISERPHDAEALLSLRPSRAGECSRTFEPDPSRARLTEILKEAWRHEYITDETLIVFASSGGFNGIRVSISVPATRHRSVWHFGSAGRSRALGASYALDYDGTKVVPSDIAPRCQVRRQASRAFRTSRRVKTYSLRHRRQDGPSRVAHSRLGARSQDRRVARGRVPAGSQKAHGTPASLRAVSDKAEVSSRHAAALLLRLGRGAQEDDRRLRADSYNAGVSLMVAQNAAVRLIKEEGSNVFERHRMLARPAGRVRRRLELSPDDPSQSSPRQSRRVSTAARSAAGADKWAWLARQGPLKARSSVSVTAATLAQRHHRRLRPRDVWGAGLRRQFGPPRSANRCSAEHVQLCG